MEVSDESDTKKYEVSMADTDFIAKLKFYFGLGYREKASATFGKSFKN
ncbi:portal protein [Enterococcus faecium]|nr:portal protein [Enterococcus faecium]EGP5616272.1 portal protein [Enterococcus faecium]EME8177072.1 portal protein [Enterococcus faecium]EMF0413173.1 portal protein [Enterococcus faecium]EMF0586233.1 portal protein [Enterococcus faecium]